MNTTKKEERKINQIQDNIIRRILMIPQSTYIEALCMETGLLDNDNDNDNEFIFQFVQVVYINTIYEYINQ